jgi:hypothetical protein
MHHRGFSFNVVQGLGHDFWRWFATIDRLELSGDASTRGEAISDAQEAIDRAVELVRPELCFGSVGTFHYDRG